MSEAVSVAVRNRRVFLDDMSLFHGGKQELEEYFDIMVQSCDSHLVVTANVDHLIDLPNSESLKRAYETASLRLVDGMPVLALARLLGARGIARHTGADLLPYCAEWSVSRGWKIAILGGAADVGIAACQELRGRFPGSTVSHVDFPLVKEVGSTECASVAEELRNLEPDIVFVCLGSPKQEAWVLHWKDELPAAVFVGAGAAVDFAAGTKKRAPQIVQRMSLEWVWRLFQEPRRLGHRYLIKGPRFMRVIAQSIKGAM